MAVDVSVELIRNLEIACQRIETLERCLKDEHATSINLCHEMAAVVTERDTLAAQLADMHAALAAVEQSQAITNAARPPAERHVPQTATRWVSILAADSRTDPSTVRWNLTYSDAFTLLRDNAQGEDGLPLTQSIRLLCWLVEHVSDGYGHRDSRYALLLHRQISLERLLD